MSIVKPSVTDSELERLFLELEAIIIFVPTCDGLKMFQLSADQLSIIIQREIDYSYEKSRSQPGQYDAVEYDMKCV